VEPSNSLRECLRGFGADPNRGIRNVIQSAHETSVRALCKRPKGPFHIVALGDSVMWGQGLNSDKFARKVQQELGWALVGPRMVQGPYIFAHSGATVAEHGKDSEEFTNPPPDLANLKPPQELPLSYPSIPRQLEMAKSWLSEKGIGHDQVDLVLLNGGINDVGALQILDPSVDSAWVRERTRQKLEFMYNPVDGVGLLPKVLETFPKAKVVISNYFQIISTDTDLNVLYGLILFFFPWAIPVIPVTAILRNKLDKQSEAFNGQWMEDMNSIIEGVRSIEPDKAERICLVDVQFSDRNAYGAPESYLWLLLANDQMKDARIKDCEDAKNHPWGEDVEFYCGTASAFHPNPAGTDRYRDAIMSGITSRGWIEEWRGGPWTPVREEMTASMNPPLGTPEERLTQWTGKISARELQSPHLPVHGTIDISRDGRVVKRVPTDAEFSWTFARITMIDREREIQWIQDDRVTVQEPYAKPFVLLNGVKTAYPL
jgi:lysophospholipase L1-like esterase